MVQIKKQFSDNFPLLNVFAKWPLLLAGVALTLLSVAFISYGLAVTTLFVGIALLLASAANFISPEKPAIKRVLNRSALVVLAGGLVFYGLLLFSSLQYP